MSSPPDPPSAPLPTTLSSSNRFLIPPPRAPLSLAEKNGRATLERRWSETKVFPPARARRSWPETEREEKLREKDEGTRKRLARKLAETALEVGESVLGEEGETEEEEEEKDEGRELLHEFCVVTPSPKKKVRRVSVPTPVIIPLSFTSAPSPPPASTTQRVSRSKPPKPRRKTSPPPTPPLSAHQTSLNALLTHWHLLPSGWLTVLEALITEGESALSGSTKGASKLAAKLALGESAAILGAMQVVERGRVERARVERAGEGEGMPPESFQKKGKGVERKKERKVPVKVHSTFVGELRWIYEDPGRER